MSLSIDGDRTTFVLIPGAGIDPGVWRWTITELQARGHRGLAPRLPLNNPDAGPSAHADAVVDAVSQVRDPLVVVGQSLGAFAASLVAARVEVAELVLVAPMIPAPGETAGDWWAAVKHDEAIAPLIQRLGGMSTWGPEELAEVFLHDVPAEHRVAGRAVQRNPWPRHVSGAVAAERVAACTNARARAAGGPSVPARIPAARRARAP